jgi:amidase
LRIGFSAASPIGTAVDPEAVAAVNETARLLATLGHQVDEAAPALDGMQLAQDFVTMWFAGCAATVDAVKAQTGCGNAGFEDDTLAMAAFGRAARASDYVAGYLRWSEHARKLAEFHAKYDLFMTPTMALPPARIGEIATPHWQTVVMRILMALQLAHLALKSGVVEQMVESNLKWVPYTQLGNLTGVPAMSVPLHWTAAGLPIGTQFVGRFGEEATLLGLATELERARPWDRRRPKL